MIFKSSKQLMAGTIAAALCVTAVSLNFTSNLSSYATSNQNEQFYIDGYHYEFYNMSNIGECSFEPDNQGGFDAEWSGIMECQFDKGIYGSELPNDPESVIINYDLEFSPLTDNEEVTDGSSRVGIYGWLVPKSARYNIEYAVIDYQCNFDTENYANILELQNIGSYELDGMTYDLYNKKADANGFSFDASVEKYFSFRRDNNIGSGASVNLKSSIDLTRHMEEWQKLGMEKSNIYSAMLDVRAWMSSGSAKLNSCDINITEREREAFTEDGCFYVTEPAKNGGDYEMKPLGEGGFEAKWDSYSSVTFRKGRSFAEAPVSYSDEDCIIADYDMEFDTSKYGSDGMIDIGVHGWLDIEEGSDWKDEFNIILGRKNYYFPSNYKDFQNNENVIELGTLEDNGRKFRLYRSIPLHNYNASGVAEAPPHARYTYWSVAEDCVVDKVSAPKLSGKINIRKHLEKFMEQASALERVSRVYEVSLNLFTMGGEGSAKVNSFDIHLGSDKDEGGKVTFYNSGNATEKNSSMDPNGVGGFSCNWSEGEYKSFSKKLETEGEIDMAEFSVDYDADVNAKSASDTEWSLCSTCKSTQSNLEYYVFEGYGTSSVKMNSNGTEVTNIDAYSFLKDHAIIKKNSAIINGERYDLFYLRYKVGEGGLGGYDIYRCLSIKQNAGQAMGEKCHLNGSIDWAKHIMAWDSAGFPITAVDSCEVFFETNSPGGDFSLNICNFNLASNEVSVKGDLNGDRVVDNFDVIACRKALLNSENCPYDTEAGDMNGNGKIDVGDLILLTRFVLGVSKA